MKTNEDLSAAPNSSPRADSNTELLCKEFERGTKESGNQIEMIRLRDYKIDFINVYGMVTNERKFHYPALFALPHHAHPLFLQSLSS